MTPNQQAFLDMIAHSEIGEKMLSMSDNGYNILVGSTPQNMMVFNSYATHPNVYNKKLNSTAAGRYQFLHKYWEFYRDLLKLPDFGHAAQDAWAIQLIYECHALDDIESGNLRSAITKCASRWASFPSAGYGQHENKYEDLKMAYLNAGGSIA